MVRYVYDYELGEPAYGQVRRVIDALDRATEYRYYAANDSNPARRGMVRRVEVPGGYWRVLDYGGAGWLVRREVQVANGSEVTSYTYDSWGRLRAIDYPRSADVSMGWDGENRRVWVQDGAGRREYSYDAWGRVVRQEGCCGDDTQLTLYSYDAAGRLVGLTDPTGRQVTYHYNPLGQLESATDNRGSIILSYDGAGRLQRYSYPDGSAWVYLYNPTTGELERQQLWNAQGEIEKEFVLRYDLRHRLLRSEETRRGEVLTLTYDDAHRTVIEQRTGELAYTRIRVYNVDGSLQSEWHEAPWVAHWWVYLYDEAGRLEQIVDVLSGEQHRFVWSGAWLVRWEASNRSYARLFSYDEEGRITQVDWESYVTGERQPGLAYRYRWGGGRWYKRDYQRELELREGCGGLVSWYREGGSGAWQVGQQAYFGLGGCCGGLSTNRSVMEDAWWMPGDFETAVPALCVGACVCGAACLALLIIPCLERARGASDPLRCLLECIKERLGNASGWVQLICGVCVVGCAVCLFVGVPGGLPAPAPVPTPVPAPVFAVASAASVVASPCDPPVAPPPGPSCTTCFRARTTFKSSYSHTFSTSHSRTES